MKKELKSKLKEIGRGISEGRKAKGLSMEDLADRIGCHRKTIQNIEAGLGGRIQTFIEIEDELQIKVI